ncbi:MAG TPA: hypothetical protein VEQ38_11675 [Verrucomicrobiae bacterium]|nr:hypothetical protein [Verrucomicrobiae bacterium]
MNSLFRTPYRRPTKLSNPHRHFSQKEVGGIIQTADDRLTWSHFNIIFHWGTPAGTYQEIAYFLPRALHHIKNNPRDALEFMSGVLCFVESNIRSLESDSLHRKTAEAIHEIFEVWTSEFVVIHYGTDACRERGWELDHQDIVQNSQSVMQLIEDIQSFPAFPELADELIQSIASQHDDHVRSAWFLEYAREMQDWSGTFIKSSATQARFFKDRDLLQDHYNRISSNIVAASNSPTYWADLRMALRLR